MTVRSKSGMASLRIRRRCKGKRARGGRQDRPAKRGSAGGAAPSRAPPAAMGSARRVSCCPGPPMGQGAPKGGAEGAQRPQTGGRSGGGGLPPPAFLPGVRRGRSPFEGAPCSNGLCPAGELSLRPPMGQGAPKGGAGGAPSLPDKGGGLEEGACPLLHSYPPTRKKPTSPSFTR